jgi:hypothetical protein
MQLVCDKCLSDQLERHGEKSRLDGRYGLRCLGCGNTMGPRRSRLLLGFLMAVAAGLTAWGLYLGLLFCTRLVRGQVSPTPGSLQLAAFILASVTVGPWVLWALLRAYRQNTPKQVN